MIAKRRRGSHFGTISMPFSSLALVLALSFSIVHQHLVFFTVFEEIKCRKVITLIRNKILADLTHKNKIS